MQVYDDRDDPDSAIAAFRATSGGRRGFYRLSANVPWASHGKIANNFLWLAIGFVIALALAFGWRT